jgi:hypothetical protein
MVDLCTRLDRETACRLVRGLLLKSVRASSEISNVHPGVPRPCPKVVMPADSGHNYETIDRGCDTRSRVTVDTKLCTHQLVDLIDGGLLRRNDLLGQCNGIGVFPAHDLRVGQLHLGP